MRIGGVDSTDLFGGTAAEPRQIVKVQLVNAGPSMLSGQAVTATVRIDGPGVSTPEPARVTGLTPGAEVTAEVAIETAGAPGTTLPVLATASWPDGSASQTASINVAEPGWVMWMVSHFHYDPVWWSTQGQFTQARLPLPDAARRAAGGTDRVRTGPPAPGRGPPRPGLQVRAGRARLPQAAFRCPPGGPRRPARFHRVRPDRARRRQLQRTEYEPDLRRVHDPQCRLRHRLPARRARRQSAHVLDARRVRLRSRLPGHHGRGRPAPARPGPAGRSTSGVRAGQSATTR